MVGQSIVKNFIHDHPLLAVVLALLTSTAPSLARDGHPAHELVPAEAKRWIAAVEGHRTKDGSTIIEALRFAEKMRPSGFKFGNFDVVYQGDEPSGVTIDYYIGLKRSDVDQWTAFFEVKRDGRHIIVSPVQHETGFSLPSDAIEAGRDALLRFVDDEYEQRCVEYGSNRKLC